MTKLGTKKGFQRVAIILPLSKTHHTGLKGVSVNAWAVDKQSTEKLQTTLDFRNLSAIAWNWLNSEPDTREKNSRKQPNCPVIAGPTSSSSNV